MDLDLEELMRLPRKYAPYYEAPDCQSKEMGILRCWLSATYKGNLPFRKISHKSNHEDPPDFVLEDKTNGKFGLEITELVDQKTIQNWVKGERQYYEYEAEEISLKVETILRKKEEKILKKHNENLSSFEEIWLLLHSDESLRYDLLGNAFNLRKIRSSVFSRIYVIMPPKPCAEGYMETLTEIDYYSVNNVNQLYEYRCERSD